MNKRYLGTQKEKTAVSFLEERGITVLEHSFRCKIGEIDIIGHDSEYLIFFEVKYRSDADHGYSAEAVNYYKQKRICRISDFYRCSKNISPNAMCRYDVISIDNDIITWYKNAFDYIF